MGGGTCFLRFFSLWMDIRQELAYKKSLCYIIRLFSFDDFRYTFPHPEDRGVERKWSVTHAAPPVGDAVHMVDFVAFKRANIGPRNGFCTGWSIIPKFTVILCKFKVVILDCGLWSMNEAVHHIRQSGFFERLIDRLIAWIIYGAFFEID